MTPDLSPTGRAFAISGPRLVAVFGTDRTPNVPRRDTRPVRVSRRTEQRIMDRETLIDEVSRELWNLDGTTLAAVALLTGFTVDAIRELGGLV